MPEWRGKPQANKLKQLKSGFTRILNSSANGAIVGVETVFANFACLILLHDSQCRYA
jgi:hypothetical protein